MKVRTFLEVLLNSYPNKTKVLKDIEQHVKTLETYILDFDITPDLINHFTVMISGLLSNKDLTVDEFTYEIAKELTNLKISASQRIFIKNTLKDDYRTPGIIRELEYLNSTLKSSILEKNILFSTVKLLGKGIPEILSDDSKSELDIANYIFDSIK